MKKKNKLKGISIPEKVRAYEKILAWFFAYPSKEFSLNELCKDLDISKKSTNEIISQLEKEGFIHKEIVGKLWRIRANPKHIYFITKKIPQNLMHIYESGIIDWINNNIPNAKAIILFGSYRWGEDIEESDLDIAVEILGNEPPVMQNLNLEKLGYKKNVKINLFIFSRNYVDLNVFSNIANGIILQGFLEVRI